ncbi:MAG: hypothetical protein ACLUL2_21460 [Blautia sp.]
MVVNKLTLMKGVTCVSFLCINIISFLLGDVGITGIARTAILMGVCYLPLLYSILKAPRSFPTDAIILAVFILGLFFLSELMHPELSDLIKEGISNSILSLYGIIAAYLFFRTICDKYIVRKALLVSACIYFVFYSYQAIISLSRGYWEEVGFGGVLQQQSYSMSFGYNMLFPTIIFLAFGLNEKK